MLSLSDCFNPRPRVGGDDVYKSPPIKVNMFQSAPPAWGATAHYLSVLRLML